MQKEASMNKDYILGMINSLENSITRAKYYEQSGDIRFLNESNEWIIVASIYMKELTKNINMEDTNESLCSL